MIRLYFSPFLPKRLFSTPSPSRFGVKYHIQSSREVQFSPKVTLLSHFDHFSDTRKVLKTGGWSQELLRFRWVLGPKSQF